MIVDCPRCDARYRVEERVLQDDPTFKCSRCNHIFAYEGSEPAAERSNGPLTEPQAPPEPPPSAHRRRHEEESLSFSFPSAAAGVSSSAAEAAVQTESRRGEDAPGPAAMGDGSEFVFGEDEFEEEATESVEEPAAEPRFVRGEDELRIEAEPVRRAERRVFVFLVLVVLVYGNLALYLRNHPTETAESLSRIPLAGRALTEDRLLQTRITLESVEGVFQQIKEDKLVFIVSGRAVNTSDEPLKGVQIESSIYDENGNALDSKSIYCGNAMSLKIVKDLSVKEISLLQRLEPPQRFEIRPGEAAGFSVVFMNPPPRLKQFSTRVVAAQRVTS